MMFAPEGVLFFCALLVLAVVLQPLAHRRQIPFPVILVLLGFVGSELATGALGVDTGVHWDNVKPLVLGVFIPIIIFSAAINTDLKLLWAHSAWIMLLAVPLTLIGMLLSATLLYLGMGHPIGFPWPAAMLCAVIISSTDTSILPSIMRKAPSARRSNTLLEGESLFTDALAVVSFSLLLGLLSHQIEMIDYVQGITAFIKVFADALVAGLLTGGVLVWLFRRVVRDVYLRTLLSLLACYGAYVLAGRELHASGVMAVLTVGLMLGYYGREVLDEAPFIGCFWEFAERVTYIVVFLLAGVTITLGMFVDRWLAMLVGVGAALISRAAIFYGLAPVLGLLPGVPPLSLLERGLMTWGGVRGTVTLALALSLPVAIPGWYTLQSIAYGIVLFNLFVQATTMPLILKRHRD